MDGSRFDCLFVVANGELLNGIDEHVFLVVDERKHVTVCGEVWFFFLKKKQHTQ